MELLISAFVVLHLLGLAAILGGWFADRQGATAGFGLLVWGARVQLLTGLILVGLHEGVGHDLNYAKITTKLVLAVAVVACTELAAIRSRRQLPHGTLAMAAAGIALVNIVVAVFWHGAS